MRPDRRMPSVEWEPKTLSLEDLKYAREAALYVLSTHSPEEAVQIFTEGLQPVVSISNNFIDSDSDDDGEMFNPGAFVVGHGPAVKRRDVVTAPF
uniref:Uncharacterized protein n=1 Tax=Leersia perrieri TaxID=77586 RepID=A0A0D9XQ67_9ORYZ